MRDALAHFSMLALFLLHTQSILKAQADPDIRELAHLQAMQTRNYSELAFVERQQLENKILHWLVKMVQLKAADTYLILPESYLQIPSALIYQTSEPDEINCVPNADVDYIPDTDLFYAVYYQYYRYLLRFGANTPLPELVFGILAHETNFLWVLGDNGDSIGPCQLHVQTAKWLYRNEFKELFSKFFYFDRNGKHHFYTQESMVAFVFEFLLQVKGYRQGREQAAIAAYNGCEIGSPYTQAVIYNTMNYLAYNVAADLLQSKAVPSSSDIRKALLTKLRKHLSLFANSDINFNEIANNYTEYVESQIGRSNNLSNGLNSELQMVNIGRSRGCVFAPKAQTGHPYIIKSENILLFSYFRENTDTVIFFHNALQTKLLNLKPTYTDIEIDSNFIYLYYDKVEGANLRRYFIRTVQEYKAVANTETIQCSKISGKIYIVPGMPVYNQVVSPQTRQSFFISSGQLDPAIRRIRKSSLFDEVK